MKKLAFTSVKLPKCFQVSLFKKKKKPVPFLLKSEAREVICVLTVVSLGTDAFVVCLQMEICFLLTNSTINKNFINDCVIRKEKDCLLLNFLSDVLTAKVFFKMVYTKEYHVMGALFKCIFYPRCSTFHLLFPL